MVGHTVRNLDTPLTGRDIMTYLFDRDLAMKSLLEVEPSWGGDLNTRMAAEAAGWRVPEPEPQAADTEAANVVDDAPDLAQ